MDTKFNFNSQVCTSRSQSERLLALGLKKETADMIYPSYTDMKSGKLLKVSDTPVVIYQLQSCYDIPAWSLHRLWEMLPSNIEHCYIVTREYEKCIADNALYYASFESNDWLLGKGDSLFDSILLAIEWLIDREFFNKEYLV